MKKLILFLFSFFLLFAAGFSAARLQPKIRALFGKQEVDLKFKPTAYPLQNRPFVITIIGHNNGASVEKTLRSVLSQNYENFRVIYIDDGSSDGSFEHARDLVYDSNDTHRVHFVQNREPLGEIANLVHSVNTCDDEEIIVLVGGVDLLSHEWVLQKLNQYYANPDLWLTFARSMEFPTFTLNEEIPHFHLKTFYASLFKQLQEEEMDMAYMLPLLEMAKDHAQSLPEILYLTTKPLKEG
jgi:glycosyltransferase involved in cell wall biosynthesis